MGRSPRPFSLYRGDKRRSKRGESCALGYSEVKRLIKLARRLVLKDVGAHQRSETEPMLEPEEQNSGSSGEGGGDTRGPLSQPEA